MDKVPNKLIVVLGMHRAGTSVITRGLKVLGVDLGDNFYPSGFDNPTGFWENLDILQLNIEMLHFLKTGWHFLTPISSEDMDELCRSAFFLRAVEILREKIVEYPIFGFKDPRVIKLLPFWKKVFAHDQLKAYYILATRHPLSVCKSLAKRDGFEFDKGYLLWLEHVIDSFSGTEGESRLVVDYDRLMKSPETEIAKVAKKFQLQIDNQELEKFRLEFLDNGLRHTFYQSNGLTLDMPPLVQEIYPKTLEIAADSSRMEDETFKNCVKQWSQEFSRLKFALVLADKLESRLADRDHLLEESCNIDIFFSNTPDGFVEEKKISSFLKITNEVTNAEFLLNTLGREDTFIRIDLGRSPGKFLLKSIRVLDMDDNIIWQWNGKKEEFTGFFDSFFLETEKGMNYISTGNDPRIFCPELPKNSSPGKIIISLRKSDPDLSVGFYVTQQQHSLEQLTRNYETLSKTVAERDRQIGSLNNSIAERDGRINALLSSNSWRLTKPLRITTDIIRGGKVLNSCWKFLRKIKNLRLRGCRKIESLSNLKNKKIQCHNHDYLNMLPIDFDPNVYVKLNPDVAKSGINPTTHYLQHGHLESRCFSIAERDGRINALLSSNSWKLTKPLRITIDIIKKIKMLPIGFDPDVYVKLNPDLAKSGINPTTHYLQHGHLEGRCFSTADCDERINALLSSNSWKLTKPLRITIDKIIRKLRRGYRKIASLSNLKYKIIPCFHHNYSNMLPLGFDPEVYVKLNPDVAKSGVNPTFHYLQHGRLEGRYFSIPEICLSPSFVVGRDTILVVSHEASRTGAPVLSFNLVQSFMKSYNVVVLLLDDGPLSDAFRLVGATVITSPKMREEPILANLRVNQICERFNLKFAIVNSVESRMVLPTLARYFVPTISLLHEFSSYTRPLNVFREIYFWSSDVVFSANVTLENMLAEYPDLNGQVTHVIPQGRCLVPSGEFSETQLQTERTRIRNLIRPNGIADNTVVILGAGFVQFRKGVDLFIECAARVVRAPGGDRCRFIWIGKGYDPDNDVMYSVYLADQIRRAGLHGHVFFVNETTAIETAYEEADLLLLSSRLDPLPNVAIDAMAYGVPVLCFNKTTGIADFLIDNGLQNHCVADYLDSADMANKILTLTSSQDLRKHIGERCRESSIAYFSMKDYIARLEVLAKDACEHVSQEKKDAEVILGSGLFRMDFSCPPHGQAQSPEMEIRFYVRAWKTEIHRRKPFPGFHPGIYLEQHGLARQGVDPFADYLREGRPSGPWNYPVIMAGKPRSEDLPGNRSVALHLHVYYPELLSEITTRLSHNLICPDLFVSIANEETRNLVVEHLKNYKGRVVDIQLVPNRGRDIGPFFTAFGQRILADYDIIGHIHTKKSTDVKDLSVGKSWYIFLLENLIGGEFSGAMADSILAKMKDDSSIGMVFPDDPFILGWSANRDIAKSLAVRVGLQELPEHFIFPMGTMFWARTSALAPLINLKFDWNDYPEEPLPYDGTSLHAIERLFPFILSVNNLRSVTTNVNGVTR